MHSAPNSQNSAYAPGDVIAGKYELKAVLGEGGMGAVWSAQNLQLDAPVAVKLIRADLDRAVLGQRLRQEARAAARLGHPAIVRVFDVGESELGDPFIVMELLTGSTLANQIAAEGRISAVHAVRTLLPVADALALAHSKGIVHRDLKPDNIFIAQEEERIQPKLVDFGIVKLVEAPSSPITKLTQVGTVLGSPDYMSPEQARGVPDVDFRTDIWSFCVMLYEAVSGTLPFSAPNYNALLRSIVEDEPLSLTDRLCGDQRLWEIVQKGIAKDRDQRWQSMASLGKALAAWLSEQGIADDICGASLESKWLLRPTDPSGSVPAFSVPPTSGVRQLKRDSQGAPVALAPTVGPRKTPFPTTDGVSSSPQLSIEPFKKRTRWPAYVAIGIVATALGAVAAFAKGRAFATPTQEAAVPEAAGKPAAAQPSLQEPVIAKPALVQAADSATGEDPPAAQGTVEPAPPSSESASAEPSVKPSETVSRTRRVRVQKKAIPQSAKAQASAAPAKPAAPKNSSKPASGEQDLDLLSPY